MNLSLIWYKVQLLERIFRQIRLCDLYTIGYFQSVPIISNYVGLRTKMASGAPKFIRGARSIIGRSKKCFNAKQSCSLQKHLRVTTRCFSTTSPDLQIYKSNAPDIELKDESVAEYLFPRYESFGDKVALELVLTEVMRDTVICKSSQVLTEVMRCAVICKSPQVLTEVMRCAVICKSSEVLTEVMRCAVICKSSEVDFPTGQQYTYSQLKDYSVKVASALTKMGYKKGDILAIYSTNNPEFVILMHAAASIGVILTTANPAYFPGNSQFLMFTSFHSFSRKMSSFSCLQWMTKLHVAVHTARVCTELHVAVHTARVCTELHVAVHTARDIITIGNVDGYRSFSSLMEDDGKAFPENVDINSAEDLYVLPYSSGTTGLPKGVMLTHNNIIANLKQYSLGILPFFHIYGMCPVMLGVLKDGGKLVTQLHIVPPIVVFMAKHPVVSKFDLSSLKRVVSGAAPLGEAITHEFMDRLKAPVTQGYGLTELSPIVNPETDEMVGVGEVGEICIKGPQVMKGYLHNEKATEEMIRDGWLHTGDIGSVDEKETFRITDRLKELVKYKGYQVPPAELEDLLLKHPAVADAAVIGLPDEEAGELPRAYVVCKPDQKVEASDILHFVENNVAPYKKLRGGVEFVKEIPKSPSGKILRRILKESLHQATRIVVIKNVKLLYLAVT
ncbi:hypothetical protein KUTeg_013400, partial [Tegillarca granosa]